MNLTDLLAALPDVEMIQPAPDDLAITGITSNSNEVKAGNLFIAIEGYSVDGHDYIPQALERGAVAVLGTRRDVSVSAPYAVVSDSRAALPALAAAFYGFPARQLKVIGVTGTDGKTTTTTFIRSILSAAGHHANMITTVGAYIDDAFVDIGVHVTTPGAMELQALLAKMVESNTEYVVLEATSHGLMQYRVKNMDFDVAVVTNITHEHLDFHGSYEAYRDAKSTLFHYLKSESYPKPNTPKVSVLNADDTQVYAQFKDIPADQHWSYGIHMSADFRASQIQHTPQGTGFTAKTPQGDAEIHMNLIGEHNVYNALAAMAVGHSQGASLDAMQRGIEAVPGVPARMQRVDLGQDFEVFVDYAHTPNALEQVLKLARQLTTGKVIALFGLSGGPRDTSKRVIMGEVAGRLADKVVITSVDWYQQDVGEIMKQIAAGVEQAGRVEGVDYWRERDRTEGIAHAIRLADRGDVVIIAGKGHEDVITYGGVDYAWNEIEAAKAGITAKLHPDTAQSKGTQ